MKKKTLDTLKDLRSGYRYPALIGASDEEKELMDVLRRLKNLKVLNFNGKLYSVENSKLLNKFIELQDFEKFNKYICKPEQKSLLKKILSNKYFYLFATIIVEEISFGKIWKFIVTWIEKFR
jgi:hypothetical protein